VIGDGVGDQPGELLEPDVEGADVANELAGHLLAHGFDRADRGHHGQDPGAAGSGQVVSAPPGPRSHSSGQLIDQPDSVRDQVGALLVKQTPECLRDRLRPEQRCWLQRPRRSRRSCDVHRARVLEPAQRRCTARPRRVLSCDQPLRRMPPQAARVLHCPARRPGRPAQQLAVARRHLPTVPAERRPDP